MSNKLLMSLVLAAAFCSASPGQNVRVSLENNHEMKGRLIKLTDKELELKHESSPSPMEIPVGKIVSLTFPDSSERVDDPDKIMLCSDARMYFPCRVVEVNRDHVVVDSRYTGKRNVKRQAVSRIILNSPGYKRLLSDAVFDRTWLPVAQRDDPQALDALKSLARQRTGKDHSSLFRQPIVLEKQLDLDIESFEFEVRMARPEPDNNESAAIQFLIQAEPKRKSPGQLPMQCYAVIYHPHKKSLTISKVINENSNSVIAAYDGVDDSELLIRFSFQWADISRKKGLFNIQVNDHHEVREANVRPGVYHKGRFSVIYEGGNPILVREVKLYNKIAFRQFIPSSGSSSKADKLLTHDQELILGELVDYSSRKHMATYRLAGFQDNTEIPGRYLKEFIFNRKPGQLSPKGNCRIQMKDGSNWNAELLGARDAALRVRHADIGMMNIPVNMIDTVTIQHQNAPVRSSP